MGTPEPWEAEMERQQPWDDPAWSAGARSTPGPVLHDDKPAGPVAVPTQRAQPAAESLPPTDAEGP